MITRERLMRAIFVSSLCLVLLTACGTKQVNLADQSSGSLRTVILREVEHDQRGLPLFVKTLNKRPVDPGERFTVGLFRGETPVKTFDIAIKRSHGDFKVPLRIVYDWTGKGFKNGAAAGFVMALALADASTENNSNELELMAGGLVAGAVVGTAGGFVVGLAASTPSAFEETQKSILRAQEAIVTYTEYEYNYLGQLREMVMYGPDTREPIVRTDFYYEDDRKNIPIQTNIRSYPENKVRVIDQNGTREVEVQR
jgi:hypothetical protein